MKKLLLTLFLSIFCFGFGQKTLYSDQTTLLGNDLKPAKIYNGETEIRITETEISVFTEELKTFENYTILSLFPAKNENDPLVMKATDRKGNDAILLLDDKVLLVIYNFEKENQLGFRYDLRK